MALHRPPVTSDSETSPDVPIGAFPFPLTDGPQETRYLTWVRNHSNYMAVRGFLDYFRSASVLLRGIILNFLIFLPSLLVIAIGLAYGHHWMLQNPFRLTLVTLGIVAVAILLFPLGVQLFKIFSFRRSLETGSESSVKLRDLNERWFSGLLLLVLAVASIETLPWILEFTQDWQQEYSFGWQGGLAAVGATLTVLSGSAKLLSTLRGAKKAVAVGLIGILGLLAPLIVILYATDFLLYGFPPSPYVLPIPILAAICVVIAIIAAIAIGVIRRVFSWKEFLKAFGLLALALFLLFGGVIKVGAMAQEEGRLAKNELFKLLNPVLKLAPGLQGLADDDGLDTEVAKKIDKFALAKRQLDYVQEQLNNAPPPKTALAPPERTCKTDIDCWKNYFKDLWPHLAWQNLQTYWGNEQKAWQGHKTEFLSGMELFTLMADLQEEPEYRLRKVRSKIAAEARSRLPAKFSTAKGDAIDDDRLNVAIDPAVYFQQSLDDRNYIAQQGISKLSADQLRKIYDSDNIQAHDLTAKLIFGKYAGLTRDETAKLSIKKQLTDTTINSTALFVGLLAIVIWLGYWLTVDVNLTSIHGLYRDRLATAFLIGKDNSGDVNVEEDLDLHHICRYETGSTAPYHLINVALNLQNSRELRIRDRQSDFFIFSKLFTGGQSTGYCRSETMEQVFPQMSLATAMAVSAAAAAPNMGRGTSPLLVAFMTMLNIRLGFWVPNPGLLEAGANKTYRRPRGNGREQSNPPPGFIFDEVFAQELREISRRREQLGRSHSQPRQVFDMTHGITVEHGLVGLAFSGGGIRSAAINLGISQVLEKYGIFALMDYMSTVSGGGYLGSSISALMRSGKVSDKRSNMSSDGNTTHFPTESQSYSEIAGNVSIRKSETSANEQLVTIEGEKEDEHRQYRFSRFDKLVVTNGERIDAGQQLVQRRDNIVERFRWRVRPVAFLKEMFSKLDETHRWVNLSDGGHIENLATIELLRRRCKYIIIGDGEADPKLHFAGLATLMRCAYLDLGIEIDINLDAIRLKKANEYDEQPSVSGEHWAIGKIIYPKKTEDGLPEIGYLLYLKSSYCGDEGEMIREYRHRNPSFPHQTTADQFFDEGQFEAYRALGQHIAEGVLSHGQNTKRENGEVKSAQSLNKMSFTQLESWFEGLFNPQT